MSDPSEESELSPIDQKRKEIDAKIGYVLDHNSRAIVVLRQQAKNFEQIAEFYRDLGDRALDVADDIATLCKLTADLAGDVITAEFGEHVLESRDSDDNEGDE